MLLKASEKGKLTSWFGEVVLWTSAWSRTCTRILFETKNIIFCFSHPHAKVTYSVEITASNTCCGEKKRFLDSVCTRVYVLELATDVVLKHSFY